MMSFRSFVAILFCWSSLCSMAQAESERLLIDQFISAAKQPSEDRIVINYDKDFSKITLETYFTGSEGELNRFKIYENLKEEKALLVFVNGRSEFIEKYDAL